MATTCATRPFCAFFDEREIEVVMLDVSNLTPAGLHNTRVKEYIAIKNNTKSGPEKLVCLEGMRALSLALQANLQICAFFICPELLRGDAARDIAQQIITDGTSSYLVSEKVLGHMISWNGPDGLAAIVQLPDYSWQHLQLSKCNTLLVLDGLQIPGNIGTIIRCSDGAGADGIIITNPKQRLSHPKLVRASMGSLFGYPVIECEVQEAASWLHRHGFQIITASPDATLSYRQIDYAARVAIVVGNEQNGISPEWHALHDVSVSIPMNGRADSLNVATAAVLLLYEAIYQQKQT
jgi:RNA methyltransferase, TrmH family